jgi:hypothetical protein
MKRSSASLLILFLLIPVAAGQAQNMPTAIDLLVVELWPDYDKASVLVLLTGTLSVDTKLPAKVILPLPENAEFHVIARIDGRDGRMKDDITSTPIPNGAMAFITPDLQFRLEYYLPYTINDHQRSFDYTWSADLPVNRLRLKVQRPPSAASFHTEPEPEKIVTAENGLVYHIFPTQAVPAGKPFSVHVDYNLIGAQLTVESLPPPSPAIQPPGLPSPSAASPGINWPVVAIGLGGLIIIIVLVWHMATRRAMSSNTGKSHKVKSHRAKTEK